MSRAAIVALIAASVLAGVLVALAQRKAEPRPALERATLLSEPRPLPEFALLDHQGQPWGAGRLRGRYTFLFFGFVNCPDVCPTTLAMLADVRKRLADLAPEDRPAVVLATVDPERDTPEVLARYVAHFDPEFTGVTGAAADVDAFARGLGVAVMRGVPDESGNYAVDHSAAIFLVDREARVTALFGAPHDAPTIAADYRRIVAEHG